MAALARLEAVRVVVEPDSRRIRIERGGQSGAILDYFDYSRTGVDIDQVSGGTSIVFYSSGRVATPTTINLRGQWDEAPLRLTVSLTGRVNYK